MPGHFSHINDPDPYKACRYGQTQHPHYHDCENCAHYQTGTCDIGLNRLAQNVFEEQRAECNRLISEIEESCNTDYEIEYAINDF